MELTYSDLKSSIISYLADRIELLPYVDLFISQCEGDINLSLKTREQLKKVTLTPDENGEVNLPDDYIMFRSVSALTEPKTRLDHIVTGTLDENYSICSGYPKVFSIGADSKIQIRPVSTTDIEIEYYSKITPLSDENPSNWLIKKSPSIYIFGSLMYASMFDRNIEMQADYTNKYNEAVAMLVNADKLAMYGQRTLYRTK